MEWSGKMLRCYQMCRHGSTGLSVWLVHMNTNTFLAWSQAENTQFESEARSFSFLSIFLRLQPLYTYNTQTHLHFDFFERIGSPDSRKNRDGYGTWSTNPIAKCKWFINRLDGIYSTHYFILTFPAKENGWDRDAIKPNGLTSIVYDVAVCFCVSLSSLSLQFIFLIFGSNV